MTEKSPHRSVAERNDAICDQFEKDFRAGRKPVLETLLLKATSAVRPALFRALLELEVELRQKAGETPKVTDYESRFPDHHQTIHATFEALRHQPSNVSSVNATGIDTSRGPVVRAKTANTSGQPTAPRSLGRFEIKSVLGEGAFGTVYRARDPQLDRDVAVKVPKFAGQQSLEDRARFLREARAAAGLHHAQICPVHEIGTIDGVDYIVLAFIDGKPLSGILQTKPKLSNRQIVTVIRKLALALQEAHDKGIIHRDLKPANIMINRKGEPVIMDFGLARRSHSTDVQISHSGQIMGTPAYMSPEQARGDGKAVGLATDIYSLGIVLYEMICGRRPFEGTVTEVIGKILHVAAPPPAKFRPDVDERLQAICLKAIAKKPVDRFASMKEFATALADYARALPSADRPTSAPVIETGKEATTNQFAELLAAISSDVESKVERAVRRVERPHRLPWWSYLAGSALMGLIVLLGILFFIRKDTVTVIVSIPIENINDPALSFILDNNPIAAAAFAVPIELKPGQHELVVNKDGQLFKRFVFDVGAKQTDPVVVQDVTPEPAPQVIVDGFVSLFNGKDLTGWTPESGDIENWKVQDGAIVGIANEGVPRPYAETWLLSDQEYQDFFLRFEFCTVTETVNSGFGYRAVPRERPSVGTKTYEVPSHLQVEIFDNSANRGKQILKTGTLLGSLGPQIVIPADPGDAQKPKNEWNRMEVEARGQSIRIRLNGAELVNGSLDDLIARGATYPGLKRQSGRIAFQRLKGTIQFRDIRIKELKQSDDGWIDLFNGNDLTGWQGKLDQWSLKDGLLIGRPCAGTRNTFLFSPRTYADFELKFQVRVAANDNSGVQIRSKIQDPSIWTASGPQCDAGNREEDYWGGVYSENDPNAQGWMLKPDRPASVTPGDWNDYLIRCIGQRVTIQVNGATTVDGALPVMKGTGLLAFQIHANNQHPVEFRNLRIRPLAPLAVVDGWTDLFNGEDLSNWMTTEGQVPRWKVENGYMEVVPGTQSLVTRDNYPLDFELHAEFWLPKELHKIDQARANSGVYLHGRHEIQICDGNQNPIAKPNTACGGLFGEIAPALNACTAPETWQTFDVTYHSPRVNANKDVTQSGRLTVIHNGQKIINDETFRSVRPGATLHTDRIGEPGPIMLQDHGSPVRFRNIRIRPIAPLVAVADGWIDLFNGRDLSGWKTVGLPKWLWSDNRLIGTATPTGDRGFLVTDAEFENFELELQYRLNQGMGSGLFLRADLKGPETGQGQLEVQIADDDAFQLQPLVATGSVYNVFRRNMIPPLTRGDWNTVRVRLDQRQIDIFVNGIQTVASNLDSASDKFAAVPGLNRKTGRIALQQNQKADVEFRNIRIRPLN